MDIEEVEALQPAGVQNQVRTQRSVARDALRQRLQAVGGAFDAVLHQPLTELQRAGGIKPAPTVQRQQLDGIQLQRAGGRGGLAGGQYQVQAAEEARGGFPDASGAAGPGRANPPVPGSGSSAGGLLQTAWLPLKTCQPSHRSVSVGTVLKRSSGRKGLRAAQPRKAGLNVQRSSSAGVGAPSQPNRTACRRFRQPMSAGCG